VFPVRCGLNIYILFRRNSVLKELNSALVVAIVVVLVVVSKSISIWLRYTLHIDTNPLKHGSVYNLLQHCKSSAFCPHSVLSVSQVSGSKHRFFPLNY
jgi:hypothetical protein